MTPEPTPILREITAAVLKVAVTVIALAFVYPCVVTTIANALNAGHVLQ